MLNLCFAHVLLVFATCCLYLQYVAQVCYVCSSCVFHVLPHTLFTTYHVLLICMFAVCCSLLVMCCSCSLCIALQLLAHINFVHCSLPMHYVLLMFVYIAHYVLFMFTTCFPICLILCCLHLYIAHCSSCVVMSITTIHYNQLCHSTYKNLHRKNAV